MQKAAFNTLTRVGAMIAGSFCGSGADLRNASLSRSVSHDFMIAPYVIDVAKVYADKSTVIATSTATNTRTWTVPFLNSAGSHGLTSI